MNPSLLLGINFSVETLLVSYGEFLKSPLLKYSAIKRGLAPQAVTDLLKITGATQAEVARILGVTEPTLRKHIKGRDALNTGISEHILEVFQLFEKGIDTFGSLEEFKNWMKQINIGIHAKPLDLLDTITGISIVMNELLRIDYGILA